MKASFKSLTFLFCLAWQSAYSQFSYPIYLEDKKEEYPPPYDPNVVIISPEVEKWMNEQLVKASEKKTIEMKTDVMGRVKSSTDKIGGRGDVKIVDKKQKRLVLVSDMHIRENEIETEHGRYEYNMEAKKYDYFLNGKQISEKEYLEYMDKSLEKFKQQKRGKRDLPVPGVIDSDDRTWIAWMTAEEIFELTKNYKELAIDDYLESKGAANSILPEIQLSTWGHNNNYKGNGIGVYVMEPYCRDASIPIVDLSKYTNKCTGTADAHHSNVVNVLQHAAPLAHIFGFKNSSTHPSNPFSYSPPLEIGSHSYGNNTSFPIYDTYDMNMDNYIYENRVINFTAAGNIKNGENHVSSPGKAMNAITVGAVDFVTSRYADDSRWKNPILAKRHTGMLSISTISLIPLGMGNDKPEIAMYTDINMGIYGSIGGTSAATPLAAGFTATLLEQHPFFKRQPALTKAVLLTGETIPIYNASSWDTDNSNSGTNASVVARRIMNYSSVAYGTRSRWWSGGNSAHFINKEIKFTENDIQANKRYRIAIAWLVAGNYVYTAGTQPQDIDLYVEQNGQRVAYSISSRNSFEVVDFMSNSNAPLVITIYRSSNSGGNVLLGYHLRENF